MISITKYRDGGQTERATVEKLKSLANNLSSEQLRETQQWLMEQINEYRQATPPPGKAFLAPRFLSYVDSLISSMQPVETP